MRGSLVLQERECAISEGRFKSSGGIARVGCEYVVCSTYAKALIASLEGFLFCKLQLLPGPGRQNNSQILVCRRDSREH